MAAFSLVRRSPGLAGLLAAQTISPLGDAMATTALILHIQRTTGSATAVGLLLFAQAIPPLAAPLAGVVADRVAPGRLLGAGWLAQAVLAGLLALSLPPLGALLAVVFALALLDTPLSAAVGRCIPAVVADEDLVAANTLRGGVQELGTVLGPPLAGLLFAASGARLVLGLDALTFLIVIPLALRLPAPPRDTTVRSRLSFARDARDGLAFVWRTRSVLAIALGFWVVVLFSAPDDLILPFLATLTFKAGPVAIGLLLAAASAGLLAGLPFVRPAGRRLGVTGAIVAGFAVMAAGNLLTAAAPWLMAAFAAQALRGLAIPLADAHVTTHLQRTTPPELLGRVLANVYGGVGVAAAVGYVIGGPIVDATSPRTAFVIVGCGGLAGAAVTALLLRGQSGRSRARTSAVRSKDLCRTGARGQHPDGDLFLSDRSCIVPVMPRPREFEPDQVLDSAMRHFWERGYRATSVDDLVRATGVKPGSLYSAFPGGKHALLMGSLERYSKLVVPQKLGELDEPGASVAQVRAYFDGLVQDLLSPEGRQGCLLVNSAIENAATDPEVAAVVRGHLARLERCFTAALGAAIRRGEIPASVDPASRAKGLVATSQGLMVIGKANPDEEVLRAVVDSAFAGLS